MKPTAPNTVICAAGGVLWRPGSAGEEIAVIHRSRYGSEWTLPKGKLDAGESWEQAALREVWEETGCCARLGRYIGHTDYFVGTRPKTVKYWELELEGEPRFEASEEVDELRWVTPDEAMSLFRHDLERGIVRQAVALRAGTRR